MPSFLSTLPQRLAKHTLTREVQFFLDLAVLTASFGLAYGLRFDFQLDQETLQHAATQLPLVVLLQACALYWTRVYSFIWRYVGLAELKSFVKAAAYSAVPLLFLRLGLPDELKEWRIPLSIILIDTAAAFGGVLALRVLRRVVYEHNGRSSRERAPGRRTLLVGAGRAGVRVARDVHMRADTGIEVVGFIDDDTRKHGTIVQGVKVLGSSRDLPRFVRERQIEQVVLTVSSATRREIRRLVDLCESLDVKLKIIPGLWELLGDGVTVSRLREVSIEDLLGREPVQIDEEDLERFLAQRCVMVTGAGGSIGSEIARQICRFGPDRVILVERSEAALFMIDRELREETEDIIHVPVVADVGDEALMRRVLEEHRPDVIFHAAAHKHVPLLEANVPEAVRNNVLGTHTLARLAGETGTASFVLISTDKAVRPSSVMGATKRLAEIVIQDLDRYFSTRYIAVRFGNVLGSAGSVIPIFREQIRKGGPVTVTHEDMVRFFMTIPEASQLVLQAGAMGAGGEIFILDMGEPVRILELAKDMIQLSGLKPYEDIDIFFTGIRPGEKLYEELEQSGEQFRPTKHHKIHSSLLARPASTDRLEISIEVLERLAHDGETEEIRRVLARLIPDARISYAAVSEDDEVSAKVAVFRSAPDTARSDAPHPSASTIVSTS